MGGSWFVGGVVVGRGVLPLLAMLLSHRAIRIPLTFAAVIIALGGAGTLGARLGGANAMEPTVRTPVGGALPLILTLVIGRGFRPPASRDVRAAIRRIEPRSRSPPVTSRSPGQRQLLPWAARCAVVSPAGPRRTKAIPTATTAPRSGPRR